MNYAALRIGDLGRRIKIQQRTGTRDAFGQSLLIWTDLLTCWASLEVTSSTEVDAGQALFAEAIYQIVILYRPTVTAAMRVIYQGKVLDILAVTDDGLRHERLTLTCKQGMTQG